MANILITGATSGIGRASALRWAQEPGHNYFLGARRLGRLEELKAELQSKGAREVHIKALDLRDKDATAEWTQSVLELCPYGPDLLILSAGLALGRDPISSAKDEDWMGMIETNLMGVLRICRAFLGPMMERNSGHIILLGSTAGHEAYEGGSVYCATKFGLKAIAKSLRLELFGRGLRLSSIDPGMVETEFSLVRFDQDEAKAKAVYEGLKPLSPEDIAEAIWFANHAPPHVNIDQMIITPLAQASVTRVARQP